MKIKKVYVILILNDEVIDLKTKIIAIVISVVITAGTATGVGIVVKQNNDKNTEELVSAAVSQALATTENTTIAESTTEETSTTRKHLGAPQPTTATTTTETTTEITTTSSATTSPAVVYNTNNAQRAPDTPTKPTKTIETPTGVISLFKDDTRKRNDEKGYYWILGLSYVDPLTGNEYILNVDDKDKVFYFDNEQKRVYPNF